MQGTLFAVSYHVPGTLAANESFVFTLPFAAQLVAVSAVASNASSGILDVGPSTDTDASVSNMDVGDSGVPALYDDKTDFEGDEYPHFAAGTIIQAELDYDGAGGTAAHDFTLVLYFTEG